MTSFFQELRRRNVFRVAAAYAVVAWIIIEAGSVLLPTFGASEEAFQVYVVIVIAGFLASLVFAWVFELTPEGVRLEKNVPRERSVTTQTGRKMDLAIIALLIVALAVSVTLNFTGIKSSNAVPTPTVDRLSIAVLPFASRSTDPDNRVFADGIHDDLLTRLANIGSLRVISRTSVQEYRDSPKNMRQIADELGVGTVLEGAVQRVGDSVRINAKLIDALTDESLWAKSYDRQLSLHNIFDIQTEISTEISRALKATLTVAEETRLASVPTENMGAYSLYTRGRANLYERRLETILTAREQFEQATGRDPNFAAAYAGLAESMLLLFNNHNAVSLEEMLTVTEAALDRALTLDPELADAYASLGLLKQKIWDEMRTESALDEAEAAFRRAIELNPNHAQAYMWFAGVRASQERYDEAIELYHRSLKVDPLGRIPHLNLPGLYALLGRNEEALQAYLDAIEIHPRWPTAYLNLAAHLLGLGRFDEALAWGARGQELSTDPLAGGVLVATYVEFGDFDSARRALAGIPEDHPMFGLGAGIKKVLDGDFAGATAAFEGVILGSDNPRPFLFDIVAICAVLAGDYATAREYTERQYPDFAADAGPGIDRFNVAAIVRYAFILQQQGEGQRAAALLDAALPVVRTLPRAGLAGHGIRDVQILALQGKSFEALTALRAAIDDGFRGSVFSNGWTLSLDPYLSAIRGTAEFRAMAAEIDDSVAIMEERALRARESGDWASLRAVTESS